MTNKNPLLSKTLWLNLIVALLALLWPQGKALLAANPDYGIYLITAANFALRFFSHGKLSLGDDEPPTATAPTGNAAT